METLSKNKTVYLRKFLQKKNRKLERKCLIEGEILCMEALNNGFEIDIVVYVQGKGKRLQQILKHPMVRSTYKSTPETIHTLSEVEMPQGIIGLISFQAPEHTPGENNSHRRYVVLENVSDPGNVGAIIRIASWFGWDGVICGSGCVEITSGKVIRSSMGAVFHLPIWENVDLPESLEMLKRKGFTIYGSTPRNGDQYIDKASKKMALIIGSEARGISGEVLKICDRLITISGGGKAESLNAAVSAGILLDRIHAMYNTM